MGDSQRSPPTVEASPPTYEGLPVIGNAHQVLRDQGAFYERASKEDDVVRLRLPGIGDLYQVSHPELVEEVLTDTDTYRKAEFTQDQLGELLGEGLVLSEGDLWRRQRQRIQPAFFRDRLVEYADTMVEEAAAVADGWADRATTVEVKDEMTALTLRILVRSMFGAEIDYDGLGIRESVAKLQEPGKPSKQPIARTVPKWVPIPMWRRYEEGIEEMEAVIEEFVEARREDDADREDLLSMLLSGTDDDGERMSEKLLRDELMTFLFAGHETTATALTFAWFLLGHHPAADRRLAEELRTVLDGDPEFEDLPDLEYTEAVFKESMRLYPPVPAIPRETARPVELGGYRIDEGEVVTCSQWAVHRDGRFWAYPHEFRPGRWIDGEETAAGVDAGPGGRHEDRPRYAFFPFGAGPRRCVGETFATVEGQLILATLARRYGPDLVGDPDPDLSVSITTQPLDPIEVRFEPR